MGKNIYGTKPWVDFPVQTAEEWMDSGHCQWRWGEVAGSGPHSSVERAGSLSEKGPRGVGSTRMRARRVKREMAW